MDTNFLYSVVTVIADDLRTPGLVAQLQQFSKLLAQSERNASTREAAFVMAQALVSGLDKSPVGEFPPTWRQVVTQLGGEQVLGPQLAARLRQFIDLAPRYPAEVKNFVDGLTREVQAFQVQLFAFERVLHRLSLVPPPLEPEEATLRVMVRADLLTGGVAAISSSLKPLEGGFGRTLELVSGRPGVLGVRSISTGSLWVEWKAPLDVVVAIAKIVAAATTALANWMKIVASKRELAVLEEAPQPTEQEEEEWLQLAFRRSGNKLRVSLESCTSVEEEGRKNELLNSLAPTLAAVANTIRAGGSIEIGEIPATAAPEASAEVQELRDELQAQGRLLQDLMKQQGRLPPPEGQSAEPKQAD